MSSADDAASAWGAHAMDISPFLSVLPVAATSPLSLVAYAVTLASATLLAFRASRNKNLLEKIDQLPPEDRKAALQLEMDTVIPGQITAEEWIRLKTRRLYFIAFALTCLCLTVVALVAMANTPLREVHKNMSISLGGPTFMMPKMNGRTIDACIISSQFPARFQMECSNSASQIISQQFCIEAGYSDAESFSSSFMPEMQLSYKLTRDVSGNGQVVQNWIEDNTGGFVLSKVACKK